MSCSEVNGPRRDRYAGWAGSGPPADDQRRRAGDRSVRRIPRPGVYPHLGEHSERQLRPVQPARCGWLGGFPAHPIGILVERHCLLHPDSGGCRRAGRRSGRRPSEQSLADGARAAHRQLLRCRSCRTDHLRPAQPAASRRHYHRDRGGKRHPEPGVVVIGAGSDRRTTNGQRGRDDPHRPAGIRVPRPGDRHPAVGGERTGGRLRAVRRVLRRRCSLRP